MWTIDELDRADGIVPVSPEVTGALVLEMKQRTTRLRALEAAHVQMQASLDHAYAEIEHWKAIAISDGQTIDYHVAEIGRLTGEKSYLSDEVIPALKAEAESLQASMDAMAKENERLRCLISRNFDAMEIAFGNSDDAKAIREIVDQQSTSDTEGK